MNNRGQIPEDLQYMIPTSKNQKPKYINEYERHGIEPVVMKGRGIPNMSIPKRTAAQPVRQQQQPERPQRVLPRQEESYMVDAYNAPSEEVAPDYNYPEQTSIPSVGNEEQHWHNGPGTSVQEDVYVVVYNGQNHTFNKDDLNKVLFNLIINQNVPKEEVEVYKKVEFTIGVTLDE